MDEEYKEAKYNEGDTVWYVDYHHFTDIENTKIHKAKIKSAMYLDTSEPGTWYGFENGDCVPEDNVFADPYEMVEEVKKHVEFNLDHYRKALVDRIEYFNQIIKQEELCS